MSSPPAPAARAPEAVRRSLGPFSPASIGVAAGFALLAAAAISPWFKTSFLVILGRTMLLALVLLLVFAATQRLPERWLPDWMPRWLPGRPSA